MKVQRLAASNMAK